MARVQIQGVHHITLVGSNRQATIDFYTGVLGMPLVFEQPNLDVPDETHLYFDPGDGRLMTFFVRPTRRPIQRPTPRASATCITSPSPSRAPRNPESPRLRERGISNTGPIDRGFMDSIYFRDPNGQLLEMACYKFDPPTASPTPTCCGGAPHAPRCRRASHRPDIWPTRSRR